MSEFRQTDYPKDGEHLVQAIEEYYFRSTMRSDGEKPWWYHRDNGQRYERAYQKYCRNCGYETYGHPIDRSIEVYRMHLSHFETIEHCLAEQGFDYYKIELETKWLMDLCTGTKIGEYLPTRSEVVQIANYLIMYRAIRGNCAYKKTAYNVVNKLRKKNKFHLAEPRYNIRGYANFGESETSFRERRHELRKVIKTRPLADYQRDVVEKGINS